MADLQIPSVELVTSPRPAPLNGAPKSSEYNKTQEEILADLAEIADLINESILPILATLPDTAAAGVDGASLFADRTTDNPLFRNADGSFKSVAQVFNEMSAGQNALTQQMTELAARVTALQTRLATTQQNDLRSSVQSLQDSYSQLVNRVSSMLSDVSNQGTSLAKLRRVSFPINEQAEGYFTADIYFNPAFPDNNYTVTLGMETSGGIEVSHFIKKDDGKGVTVALLADDTQPSGTLHVLAMAL